MSSATIVSPFLLHTGKILKQMSYTSKTIIRQVTKIYSFALAQPHSS